MVYIYGQSKLKSYVWINVSTFSIKIIKLEKQHFKGKILKKRRRTQYTRKKEHSTLERKNLLHQKQRTQYTIMKEPIILARKNLVHQKGRNQCTRKKETSTLERNQYTGKEEYSSIERKNLLQQKGRTQYIRREESSTLERKGLVFCTLEKVYKRCIKGTTALFNNNNLTVNRRT